MYFDYLDALAGSGKTHWVIEKALELAEDGEKVLIAVPSKRLADEEYLPKLRRCLVIAQAPSVRRGREWGFGRA